MKIGFSGRTSWASCSSLLKRHGVAETLQAMNQVLSQVVFVELVQVEITQFVVADFPCLKVDSSPEAGLEPTHRDEKQNDDAHSLILKSLQSVFRRSCRPLASDQPFASARAFFGRSKTSVAAINNATPAMAR